MSEQKINKNIPAMFLMASQDDYLANIILKQYLQKDLLAIMD